MHPCQTEAGSLRTGSQSDVSLRKAAMRNKCPRYSWRGSIKYGCVADHRDRGERHGERGNHRAQQNAERGIEDAGRNRHAHHVVDEGEKEVLPDVAHRCPAQRAGACNAGKIAFDKRDAGALDRDFRACAHGDADIGRGQCRRVVDAVACHGDRAPLGAQLLHDLVLVLRQDIGDHVCDAEFFRDSVSRTAIVAREHHDANAFGPKLCERVVCGRLDGIGDGYDASRPAIEGEIERRRTFAAQCIGAPLEITERNAEIVHELRIAKRNTPPRYGAGDALAGDGRKFRGFLNREPALLSSIHHGSGERMFACTLKTGCQRQNFLLSVPASRHNVHNPRPSLGERPGLIDDERINLFHMLERFGRLDENASTSPLPYAHHDRHRCRQTKRARARNDDDRNRSDKRITQCRRRSPNCPADEGERGDCDHRRHEPAGHSIRETLNGCA